MVWVLQSTESIGAILQYILIKERIITKNCKSWVANLRCVGWLATKKIYSFFIFRFHFKNSQSWIKIIYPNKNLIVNLLWILANPVGPFSLKRTHEEESVFDIEYLHLHFPSKCWSKRVVIMSLSRMYS